MIQMSHSESSDNKEQISAIIKTERFAYKVLTSNVPPGKNGYCITAPSE